MTKLRYVRRQQCQQYLRRALRLDTWPGRRVAMKAAGIHAGKRY